MPHCCTLPYLPLVVKGGGSGVALVWIFVCCTVVHLSTIFVCMRKFLRSVFHIVIRVFFIVHVQVGFAFLT